MCFCDAWIRHLLLSTKHTHTHKQTWRSNSTKDCQWKKEILFEPSLMFPPTPVIQEEEGASAGVPQHVPETLCVSVLLTLWGRKPVYTAPLWGLASLQGTQSRAPWRKSFNFRIMDIIPCARYNLPGCFGDGCKSTAVWARCVVGDTQRNSSDGGVLF